MPASRTASGVGFALAVLLACARAHAYQNPARFADPRALSPWGPPGKGSGGRYPCFPAGRACEEWQQRGAGKPRQDALHRAWIVARFSTVIARVRRVDARSDGAVPSRVWQRP